MLKFQGCVGRLRFRAEKALNNIRIELRSESHSLLIGYVLDEDQAMRCIREALQRHRDKI